MYDNAQTKRYGFYSDLVFSLLRELICFRIVAIILQNQNVLSDMTTALLIINTAASHQAALCCSIRGFSSGE